MVNALRLAAEFITNLPKELSPEETSDRDGFIHPVELTGSSEKATIRMILRDFELTGLEAQKKLLQELIKKDWNLSVTPQYRNMRYWLDKDPLPIEYAKEAMLRTGLKPLLNSVRGGTDGSRLTERGLLTPNLFTGFHNIHSEKEWVSLQDMALSATALVHLAQIFEEKSCS